MVPPDFVHWYCMKRINARFLCLVFAMFFASQVFALDTLEVFILRVQFAEEKPDNSLTSGTGVFGSVPEKNYSLDPTKSSGKAPFWQKHLEFANAYYNAASGGKLSIKTKVFSISKLKKHIIDYNRTTKMEGEKTAEFDEARSRDYLTFIYDAIAESAKDTSAESPFRIPLSKDTSRVKRAYMIVHAGANRLVDGGSMGTDGADTPGDFMDVYISRGDWMYLMPDSAKSELVRPAFGVDDKGDTVVNGLLLPGSSIDTLRSVMVVSETASQDGLNWGVNGIIVNQIGCELGLPNTYDVVKGISRLGYFDVMDFAGYSAGNGFLPALPAAWERAYMGWSKVQEVRPTAGKPVQVKVAAAGSGLGTEIVKVPLNANEYLLIENRQRSWNKDGTVSFVLGSTDEDSDTTMRTVSVDSLGTVFEDSTCVKGKCKVNNRKAKGLIVGMSSYDAGIPASGIAVWKVNDWHLRETLQYGAANFWGGDTLRDHQFGISLVESDGVLSIGKTFKNALGQDTYDYGSGTDLLPHLRVPNESSKKKFETVTTIAPTGYANTATTQGGYTGIKIKVDVPDKARKEKTANAFMGDSVINYGALEITVTISIDDGSIEGSKFPKNVGLANAVRGAVFIDNPDEADAEKAIVFAAEDGSLQVMNAFGDSLFASDTSVRVSNVSKAKDFTDVPLYRVGNGYGPLVGIASDGKDVFSLHQKRLLKTSFTPGMFTSVDELALDKAVAGPVVANGKVWVATKDSLLAAGEGKKSDFAWTASAGMDFAIHDMAYCKSNIGSDFIGVVGEGGRLAVKRVDDLTKKQEAFNLNGAAGEVLRVACADVDRDDTLELAVIGSRGTFALVKENGRVVTTQKYKRGSNGVGDIKHETSGIAIGDVNGDNYPEIVLLGNNLVYALDRFGLPLPNFPVTLSRGTPVVGFFSDPLLIDVTGDEAPEILVPSSDGLVYAYTGKGAQVKNGFPLSAGSFEYGESYSPMSIFAVDAVPDKKSKGPELYAFHRNSVNAFRLNKAANGAESAAAAWALPAAGNERTGFFDATVLGKIKKLEARDEITEFFVYPNPVRGGIAKSRFEIGAAAEWATLEFYDITGLCVFKKKLTGVGAGRNEFGTLDLKQLGSDVYTARLKVKFVDGKTKQKLYRVGVVR